MADLENEDKIILEANTVYLLMKKGFPISRNVRAQWLLEHLDFVIELQYPNENEEAPELEIVSVLPNEPPAVWSVENRHQFLYKIVETTSIIFLAHKYRMVFSLDLSPSLATVDTQHGEIVIDEVCLATKQCLEGIVRPFTIPGSKHVMHPEIYITVIAHTPFFTSPAQQVLIQGWLVTMDNVSHLIQLIEKQLNILENILLAKNILANQQLESLRAESERLVGGLFEEGGTCYNKNNTTCIANTAMVLPEASFINMLRYGMLALTLLPEHSCAHLIVVSDGIIGVTDIHVLDSIIQQLRATTVACSFLHVGSAYHPHCADGLVPYQDLLCFLAMATLGSYMTYIPQTVAVHKGDMNIYHKHYLCWQLYRDSACEAAIPRYNGWHSENSFFHGHKPVQLLRKKQIDDKVTCTLNSLLCCRLREGYLIKKASIKDDVLEICFILLWKTNVFLEYLITCPWSSKSLSISNVIQYTITIEAPYEFLHDITCLSKKPLKSQYRQGVVSRFWTAITSLTESDNMLAHFSWFPGSGWTWYSVPDTIRSGMPVFYLSAYPSPNTVQLSDAACPQFGQIWQPVVSLDPLQWARWMHTQRITLILSHDRPLPKYLHQANQSGRFQCIQCRQAAAVLYAMLKTWATFVLVENHTYVQFIYREAEKPPVSFSLIRINCKALCVVLNIAFAGGTEGVVRHNVVVDLVERLSKLTLPNRPTEQRETPCCIIIHKSLERILIRYERMPNDLSLVIFPDGTQPNSNKTTPILSASLTTTLSRYIYHNRWLWHVKRPLVQTIPGITIPRLNITAIARILSTITKMRLAEGFNFAYSAAGIINMVLEVYMQGSSKNSESFPCIIQYILFPPHVVTTLAVDKEGSDEDTDEGTVDGEVSTEDCEGSGDFQIVMEMWIEPQFGYVQIPPQYTATYMHHLQYHQISNGIAQIDEECINALLTLEHLSLLSQVIPAENSNDIIFGQAHQGIRMMDGNTATNTGKTNGYMDALESFEGPSIVNERIHQMHFTFDTLSILPKCQQAELLFSMFANGSDCANRILMEGFLDRIKYLHNKELLLTSAESYRFTKMLLQRPRDEEPSLPFFSQELNCQDNGTNYYPRWRCFVKGISATHVIITILPASEKDVRLITYPNNADENFTSVTFDKNCESDLNLDSEKTQLTKETNTLPQSPLLHKNSKLSNQSLTFRDTLKTSTRQNSNTLDCEGGLIIPVYVYDCSLALLIDALVEKLKSPASKDIYQDHTFKVGQQSHDDFINLKCGNNTKPSSPEPKSEDSDNTSSDQRSLIEHCKLLSLAHCHCYVVAIYKSLTLQQPLSYEDIEAAVEQCEETLIEINITNYLQSVCKHLSPVLERDSFDQLKVSTCNDVKPLHNLIKDKFEGIITVAFRPVPTHPEFYYCSPSWITKRMDRTDSQRLDSDDELEDFTFHSDILDCKLEDSSTRGNQETNVTWRNINLHNIVKLSTYDCTESLISDLQDEYICSTDQPFFLQLSCSIHFRSGLSSIPVKFLPTCFTEIIQKMDDKDISDLNPGNLKITLDIICLNLPREVVDITIERYPGLRTTSYCSSSPLGSVSTEYGSSPSNDRRTEPLQERMKHLPLYQHSAITNLKYEIEWLLQNETATALLDQQSPTEDTLKFVARHVSESTERSCCSMEKVLLHFVFPSENSGPKFLEELKRLQIDKYCIRQEGSLFYFIKNVEQTSCNENEEEIIKVLDQTTILKEGDVSENIEEDNKQLNSLLDKQDSGDPPGCYSEISSINEGKTGTDDGYEGDSSNSEDDFQWLIELDKRRKYLPNFWLILKVDNVHVDIYFHCRFLELASSAVDSYKQIQKMLITQIKVICRRVNQYLLLQSLHDTRMCDTLLEPELNEDHTWRGEANNELGRSLQYHNSVTNFTPGMFRCPVVWEVPFCLHPRLKTGPGKSGLSRGIKALHGVLNRFSVNNRSNMFVYQENNENVFYLRLHEQTNDGKSLQNKLSESDEKLVVSRSNSVASLSQAKSIGLINNNSATNDTRPRVRSFGEKESDILNKAGDSIILMVHGISDAGPAVKCDLVQVLQNRLDDAVLEVLSVMLARNPMCKLTPSDVHFIQKPYKSPERIVQLSVQSHCLSHIGALGYYLRQNLLQFLYIPKYTDHRAHYHFQDYSQPEGSVKRVPETNIFLYNQSHSSGSKGIACIALAFTNAKGETITTLNDASYVSSFPDVLKTANFESTVSTYIYDNSHYSEHSPETLIEFRIWKQGRVNMEALLQKLCAAVKHATWDFITEYNLLSTALTEPLNDDTSTVTSMENRKAQRSVQNANAQSIDAENWTIDQYGLGEEGKLCEIYHTILAKWFQFALEVGVPATKKHEIPIDHRHAIPVIVREFQNLISGLASDTATRAFVLHNRQPFVTESKTGSRNLSSSPDFNNEQNIDDSWSIKEYNETESPIYVPCDFSKDELGTYTKCILIGRNFYQWKASFSKTVEPELLVPKDQKLLQKFNPLILQSSFVPRQRILLAEIQSGSIIVYMYNWSKEKSEKLIKQSTNLGSWLSSRSNLFTNIIMQKLGIFHHQPMTDHHQHREQNNSQYYQITDMESLTKFPQSLHTDGKEWTRSTNRIQHVKTNPFSWNQLVGQVMRDAKSNIYHSPNTSDPVVKTAHDLQDLRHREKRIKEDLNRLYAIWQSRTAAPNIPVSLNTLNTFKQYSRLIHFCHTPLLFLPTWRLQSAATRDHSLTPSSSLALNSSSQQIFQQVPMKEDTLSTVNEKWHQEFCDSMLSEYKQYLQILGFSPIQVESSSKIGKEQIRQQTHYLKKSMLGGVLLFEMHLSQPFFIVKLRIIECNRLQIKTNSAMINQFVLSFVDVCDEIKINMHLHSFTYDFHLRCIHSYIAGTGLWSLQQGYHLTHFLNDFSKYYSKAPNYARNLVYSDVITIRNLTTPAHTLYSYLLSHEKTYGMQVFIMSNELQESQENEYVLVKFQSTPLVSYCDAQDTRYIDDFDVALIVSRLEQPSQLEKTEITIKYYLMLTSKRELYPKRDAENNKLGKFRTVYSVIKPATNNTYTESSLESNLMSSVPLLVKISAVSANVTCNSESNQQSGNSNSNTTVKDIETKITSSSSSSSSSSNSNCSNSNNNNSSSSSSSNNNNNNNNNNNSKVSAPTPPPVPNSPLTQNSKILNSNLSSSSSSPHLIQIRQESVNYLGYYSSHEQLMQQMIMSQAQAARQHIINMIERGASQCRTHLLWNKLLENKSSMTYTEFMELCSLAHIEPLSNLDPRLNPFVSQSITWYQTLSKILQNKYQDHHKQFNTPDGNTTHHLILHPSFLQAFMMLTIDLHTSRGDLCAVYCKSAEFVSAPFRMEDIYNLIEGFVNACCFHLWMGLCNQ